MNCVNELFGIYTNGENVPDLSCVLASQACPWSSTTGKCYKTRKSDSSAAIGTCSVCFNSVSQPVLICPTRMKDRNKIFMIACSLFLIPLPAMSSI